MKLVVAGFAAAILAIPVVAPAAEPFVFTDAMAAGQTLNLSDINGNVSVVNGSRLEVRATKIPGRHGNPDDVKIITQRTASGIAVCVQYPNDSGDCTSHSRHSSNDNDTQVDFSVHVPRGVNVDATSVNGAVDVHTDALASGQSVNGNVRVDAEDVRRAATVNGSINVRVHDARSTTALHLSTINGSVTCTLPAAVGVHVHASVLNGSITAGDLAVKRSRYGPGASVDGSLGDGRRDLHLDAINGNLTVTRA